MPTTSDVAKRNFSRSSQATPLILAIGWLVLFATVSRPSRAGTLVFPPPDNARTCQSQYVSNTCGTNVIFLGGTFKEPSGGGAVVYAGGNNFSYCTSAQVGFTFNWPATAMAITIRNDVDEPSTDPEHPNYANQYGQSLKVRITDLPDGVTPVVTETLLPFTGRGTTVVNAAGVSLSQVSIAVVDAVYGTQCDNTLGNTCSAAWTITSVSATQPVTPTVSLSVSRNSDGTYSATTSYAFPASSQQADRTLTLSLLPSGEEPGQVFSIQPGPDRIGSVVQPNRALRYRPDTAC